MATLKPLYTWYIVHKENGYEPVLIAANGKIPLNEPVNRPGKAEAAIKRLGLAIANGRVATVRISQADFEKKFPAFARNAGGSSRKK